MLLAFAGFGGAGKTTAIEHLARQRFGQRVYLGQAVLDEIDRLGLELTPQSEGRVRMELRDRFGPGAFADRGAPEIEALLRSGECPLVDAIFKPEEYARLQSCGQERSVLIAIEASFDVRAERLQRRDDRAYTPEELRRRDQMETADLGTSAVIQAANFRVSNEGSLEEFHQTITTLWQRINS